MHKALVRHIYINVARPSPCRIPVAAVGLAGSPLQQSLRRPYGAASPFQQVPVVQARYQSTGPTSRDHDSEPRGATPWLLRGSSVRVSTLFTALLALGAGATALGLYEIYTSFTLWPVEIRKDLRAGIRARNDGDFALSERFLARAYQNALALPLSALGPEPYLKLSGIAAVLTEVSSERRAKAVLQSVWDRGEAARVARSDPPGGGGGSNSSGSGDWAAYTLTNQERLRQVAIACKIAELYANEGGREGAEEEERWLVWAVEEVLRLAGTDTTNGRDATVGGAERALTPIVLAELQLPSWMRRADLGAPLAALASVYARKGNVEYAMPLYLQAISLLVPANREASVSVEERCEAAQLMNNLSELVMRRPPSPEIRHQAEAWAHQAHGLIGRVQETRLPRTGWFSASAEQSTEVCDQVLGVVLFNLGMLREMDDDHAAARSLYEQSLRQCEKVGMNEGVMQTKQALRRLGRVGGDAA